MRPSWYALDQGGWRDYVTLLHLPYTAWHLSYVVIGGCLAPAIAWGRLGAAVAAFALAVGIGAHALDELRGRPLRTRIPDAVLVALAVVSIGAACAIGIVGALTFRPWLLALVPIGLFLVVAYNLELFGGRFHSDLWFGLAWGGFPLLAGYAAVAGEIRFRGSSSRQLSPCCSRSHSASCRTASGSSGDDVTAVHGELELADGSRESVERGAAHRNGGAGPPTARGRDDRPRGSRRRVSALGRASPYRRGLVGGPPEPGARRAWKCPQPCQSCLQLRR